MIYLLDSEAQFPMVSFMFICILKNRKVVLITNVKPGKLRDVMSEGLVIFSWHFDEILIIFFSLVRGVGCIMQNLSMY